MKVQIIQSRQTFPHLGARRQIEVSNWQNGFYSVVITNSSEEVLFISDTEVKN